MKLILVRHGETQWNKEKRIVGHTEIELNEVGRSQVMQLARVLSGETVSAIYSSPLRRARQTAEEIARVHHLDIRVEDALKEFDAGDMNGMTILEVSERYGDFFDRWMEGTPGLRMPGGESISDLKQRAWPTVERIVQNHRDEAVIVVSHTITILTIVNSALGMSLENFRRLRLEVGSISVLEFGKRGASLLRFNDTCHWKRAEGSS
jgi:broad specificity phosphatase PhoE